MYSVYQKCFNKPQILRLSEKALEVCSQGWGVDQKANMRRNWETENVLILPKIPGGGKKDIMMKGLGIGSLSTIEGKLCRWIPC